MAKATVYIVKSGDWLAKIAEEHGTTVPAIWNHPENAALRAQRGSPDVLYPGDVLHLPAAAAPSPAQPPPPQPPVIAGPPLSTAPDDPPWPYEAHEVAWTTKPTWDCPEGICACHPSTDEEPRQEHVIVFHNPQGRRMAHARCRVYEQGRLITEEPTKADARGELTVEIRASTSTLQLEWAPPELPLRPFMPYRKLYHVRLGEEAALATDRRLSNLGFARRRRREDNVKDYQRAYGQDASGDFRHVAVEVAARHDDGQLPMFPPQPPPDAMPEATSDATPDADSPTRSFFASPSRRSLVPAGLQAAPNAYSLLAFVPTGPQAAPSDQSTLVSENTSATADDATPAQGGGSTPASGGQNTQGAVVPEVGHVWLMVGLEPGVGPLNLGDVTARLRPRHVPSMTAAQLDALVEPTIPGVFWDDGARTHIVFAFQDVPIGTYTALAHIGNVKTARAGYAIGSSEADVKMGLLTLCYVGATADRPILTVADPLLDLDVPVMQRRRKVLATIFKHFPQSADYKASAKGVAPPYDQGTYKPMYTWDPSSPQNSCAPVNNTIMNLASGSLGNYGTSILKSPGYVEYTHGIVPSVGDSLYLTGADDEAFHHCGIVVKSSTTFGDVWLMADGGQPDRTTEFKDGPEGWRRYYSPPPSSEAAFIVPRLFSKHASRPSVALLGNRFIFPTSEGGGYRLKGWVDITHPKVPFPKAAYDVNGTEADYRAFKTRALAVPRLVDADRAQCLQKQRASPPDAPGSTAENQRAAGSSA